MKFSFQVDGQFWFLHIFGDNFQLSFDIKDVKISNFGSEHIQLRVSGSNFFDIYHPSETFYKVCEILMDRTDEGLFGKVLGNPRYRSVTNRLIRLLSFSYGSFGGMSTPEYDMIKEPPVEDFREKHELTSASEFDEFLKDENEKTFKRSIFAKYDSNPSVNVVPTRCTGPDIGTE